MTQTNTKKVSAKQRKNQVMNDLSSEIRAYLNKKVQDDTINFEEAAEITNLFKPVLDTYKVKYKAKRKSDDKKKS